MTQPAFVESQHPRSHGKFAAKQQTQNTLPSGVQANVADFQKRMGLPTTGKFDARTLAAIHTAETSSSTGGGSGAKKQARILKHQAALARSNARQSAKEQRQQDKKAAAFARSVNKLPAGARATYRVQNKGAAPTGFQWTANQTLVPIPPPTKLPAHT